MQYSTQSIQSVLKKSILVGVSVFSIDCSAGEGYFGWVYGLDLQPQGKWEFEQRLQLTRAQETGTYDLWQGRTEVEYGLSNDIQLAGYLNTYSINAANNNTNSDICNQGISPCTGGYGVSGLDHPGDTYSKTNIDGISLEGIWRITNPVTSPIGIGLYLEPTIGHLKNALESRLILQSNFLDDRLQLVGNIVYELEHLKFDVEPIEETVLDFVGGFTYRILPNLNVGLEYRFHNDFDGYTLNSQTQRAHFWGPNIHYATKDWWITAAMRTQIGGQCWDPGTAECSNGKVWDSHGKNEYIVKFGMPF